MTPSDVKSITLFRHPTSVYRAYQHYYVVGLKESGVAIRRTPSPFHLFGRRTATELFGASHDAHVGQYVVELADGTSLKCAIDAHDGADIKSQDVHAWADLYFKANRWPSRDYPPNVVPIVNGNGVITPRRIERLKRLRDRKKDLDLVFVSRVWGGREHNIRLFEQIARVKANKYVLAIFTPFDRKQPQTVDYQRRLERAGVEWTYDTMSLRRLWDLLSRARVVVSRAGKHLCIPWRMIDLLCMGSCIALDAVPYPQWPEPLVEGRHFYEVGLHRPANTDAGDEAEYEHIPERLEALLADAPLQESLARNAQTYFDEHAAPERVAAYFLNTCQRTAATHG